MVWNPDSGNTIVLLLSGIDKSDNSSMKGNLKCSENYLLL
jgi:hypothetical protein